MRRCVPVRSIMRCNSGITFLCKGFTCQFMLGVMCLVVGHSTAVKVGRHSAELLLDERCVAHDSAARVANVLGQWYFNLYRTEDNKTLEMFVRRNGTILSLITLRAPGRLSGRQSGC
ncbi:unnamed protein product [Ostreobium quekettii]|uniref:Uncharacterized protein n=1 Tax=Ostreobium quekettii TaxID=121088 RepID=A0A8S1ILU1_9CHLO|nr:unnamed protein product [Ostreobium quekettii]